MVLRKRTNQQKISKSKPVNKKVRPKKTIKVAVKKKKAETLSKDSQKSNKKIAQNTETHVVKRQYWTPDPDVLLQQLQEVAKKPVTERLEQDSKIEDSKDKKRKKLQPQEKKPKKVKKRLKK